MVTMTSLNTSVSYQHAAVFQTFTWTTLEKMSMFKTMSISSPYIQMFLKYCVQLSKCKAKTQTVFSVMIHHHIKSTAEESGNSEKHFYSYSKSVTEKKKNWTHNTNCIFTKCGRKPTLDRVTAVKLAAVVARCCVESWEVRSAWSSRSVKSLRRAWDSRHFSCARRWRSLALSSSTFSCPLSRSSCSFP